MHLDLDGAVARARLATTTLHVKGEPSGLVAADLGLLDLGEELADLVEHAGVGRRVRSWRATDWLLVNGDDFVEVRDAQDGVVLGDVGLGPVDLTLERTQENRIDQGRLSRTRHARDRDERAERDLDADVLQVVGARALDRQFLAVALAPVAGVGIDFSPDRYCPVIDRGFSSSSL